MLVVCGVSSEEVLHAASLADKLEEAGHKLRTSDQLFIGVVEEKKGQLASLQKTLETFSEETRRVSNILKEDLERISSRLIVSKSELKKNPDDELFSKQLFVLNEMYQTVQDVLRLREQIRVLLELFMVEVKVFLDDPDFEIYKTENRLHDRLYYSFEDLQKMHQRAIEQEKRVDQLADQERNAKTELAGLKRAIAVTTEMLKKKQIEIEELTASVDQQDQELALETERTIILARDQEQQYRYKVMFDELAIRENEYKISLYAHQSFMAKSHLGLFRDYIRKIKPAVRVSEADIAYAKDELSRLKQEYYKTKELYRQELDKLQDELKRRDANRQAVSTSFNITLGREIDDFTKDPAQTVDAYLAFCSVTRANVDVLLLKSKIDLVDVHITLEDEKLRYSSIAIEAKQTYYNITMGKLTSEDDIRREINKYVTPSAEAKSTGLRYKEKIAQTGELLGIQKGVIDAIVRHKQELVGLKRTVFKTHIKEYAHCLELLTQSENVVKERIDVLSKLTGVYSGVVSTVNNSSRLINFIKTELEAVTIWYRPEYAISWQAARNIPADMRTFFSDIRTYLTRFDGTMLTMHVRDLFHRQEFTVVLIIKILLFLFFLFLAKRYAPLFIQLLTRLYSDAEGLSRFLLLFCVALVQFIQGIFWSLMIWLSLYFFLQWALFPDPYLYVLFYLASIPYFVLLTYLFVRHLVQFNERNSYVLLMKDFQRRFVYVFSVLMYSTISITLFREAFMLTNYYKSELPRVLLAVNFVIQVLLIFFVMPKDQLLDMIPTTNAAWRWLGREIARYYYPLLCFLFCITILGSPYIGHFRLVEYMFFAFIKTVVLLIGLSLVYGLCKRLMYRLFFITDKEIARERFAKSKTWFGFSIIVLLLCFAVTATFIGARIWGWPVDVADMVSWLNHPLMGEGTASPITTYSFLQVIGFILIGLVLSYLLNKFVFDKIFDLLLVDMGVQHTVTRITHYVVLIIAVLIGFQSVGLGQMIVLVIGALALSLGWVLKEPISDFVAYFIILVQRPLKIGDYVKIDEEMQGVVRKITPRSVILRRKNSTTIVVPNSMVTTNYVINWNYTRSFIALNDIELVIPFKEDPAQVQELLRQVLESHPNILKTPPVVVRLEEFTTYGYKFMIRGFVSSVYTLEMWNIASDVRIALVKRLREQDIEIAIPIRMVKRESMGDDAQDGDHHGHSN